MGAQHEVPGAAGDGNSWLAPSSLQRSPAAGFPCNCDDVRPAGGSTAHDRPTKMVAGSGPPGAPAVVARPHERFRPFTGAPDHAAVVIQQGKFSMMATHAGRFPKLHNSAWPGVVGKGEGGEPPIPLETMLDLTAAANVDGVKFDGVDLALHPPHVPAEPTDDEIKALAEAVASRALVVGSVGAPVWAAMGGGPALDAGAGRTRFLAQVRKACRIAARLRALGVRPYGIVRID